MSENPPSSQQQRFSGFAAHNAAYVEQSISTFPARLRAQLGIWSGGELNIRAFAKALEGVHGASRPMIHRYLDGAQTPALTFCIAAANVLEVDLEWLLTGTGVPYPKHSENDSEGYWREFNDTVYSALLYELGSTWANLIDRQSFDAIVSFVYDSADEMNTLATIANERDETTTGYVVDGGGYRGKGPAPAIYEIESSWEDVKPWVLRASWMIARALAAPLRVVGLTDPSQSISSDRLNAYVRAAVPALASISGVTARAHWLLRDDFGLEYPDMMALEDVIDPDTATERIEQMLASGVLTRGAPHLSRTTPTPESEG